MVKDDDLPFYIDTVSKSGKARKHRESKEAPR